MRSLKGIYDGELRLPKKTKDAQSSGGDDDKTGGNNNGLIFPM